MEGKGGIEDGQQQAAKTVEDDSHIKKKGWALIVHDFKQKELIPIKLLSFIVLASNYIYSFTFYVTLFYFKFKFTMTKRNVLVRRVRNSIRLGSF